MKRESKIIASLSIYALRIQASLFWKFECALSKLFFLCFFLFSYALISQPTFQLAKNIGGNSTTVSGSSIISDGTGNIYTTGIFYGTVDFDPGPSVFNLTSNGFEDFFITKFDALGNFLWAKAVGGLSSDNSGTILVDGVGNIYIAGAFYSSTVDFDPGAGTFTVNSKGDYDVFVLKLDPAGNFIWVKTVGGPNYDSGGPIKLDAIGNIYITGSFMGTSDFDPGPSVFNLSSVASIDFDIFVVKLDASGNFVWAKSMGGNGIDQGASVEVDALGNVYTTGDFEVVADFDPGGGVYNLTSAGDYDIFISKLDPNGNFVWAKAMGGAGQDVGTSINLDPIGNILTTGYFKFTADFDPSAGGAFQLTSFGSNEANFVSKLDVNGNFIWAKTFAGTPPTGVGIGLSIATDASGNVYSTGYFLATFDFDPNGGVYNKTSVGSQDIFISKLDANGNFLCAGTIGGPANDIGVCVSTHTNGNLYATGSFTGTVDFDMDTSNAYSLTSTSTDAFVGKFLQNCLGTGINENASLYIPLMIYPNPVNSVLNISNELELEGSSIEIINCLGQIVMKFPYQKTINVSLISAGIYGFRITSKNSIYFSKFIKE